MTDLRPKLSDGPLSITNTALWTSQAAADHPRDEVFGLLNLITPQEASIIGSDCSLAKEQVFARATFASLVIQQSMKVLELAQFNSSQSPELPSWVVNFDNADLPTYLASDAFEFGLNLPKTYVQLSMAFNLDPDCKYLTIINAIILDRIVTTLNFEGNKNTQHGISFARRIITFLRDALLKRPLTDGYSYLDTNINENYIFRTDPSDILLFDGEISPLQCTI